MILHAPAILILLFQILKDGGVWCAEIIAGDYQKYHIESQCLRGKSKEKHF
jgi:hypothetical protein